MLKKTTKKWLISALMLQLVLEEGLLLSLVHWEGTTLVVMVLSSVVVILTM
jgi:hypothetical protein